MIINAQTLSILFTGFKTKFNNAFEGEPVIYPKIAMEVSSLGREETYGWLGLFPVLREWLGDRILGNLGAHSYTIKNRKFELTISVPRDDIADDRFGVFAPIIAEMGRAAKVHPDELLFALLGSGFTTVCYDGQFFFDTDHPVADANGAPISASNYQAGAGSAWYLFDGSRAVKPLVFQKREGYEFQGLDRPTDENVFMRDNYLYGLCARVNAGFGLWQLAYASKATLDATNYAAARAAMMSRRGDNGRLLGVRPTHLIVPPSLEAAGRTLLKAQNDAAGAGNIWYDTAELIVSPYLS
jgi:phage major head subunit gpT-like protein